MHWQAAVMYWLCIAVRVFLLPGKATRRPAPRPAGPGGRSSPAHAGPGAGAPAGAEGASLAVAAGAAAALHHVVLSIG